MSAELIQFNSHDEWLAYRRGGLGGSDAAASIGVDPWKSRLQLWAEKCGMTDDSVDNEAVQWGKRLEPLVATAYSEATGRELTDMGLHTYVHKDLPFRRASIDRIQKVNGGHGVLEIKTTGAYREKDLAEELPINWEVQVQHELSVLGYDHATLAILLNGNKLFWKDVEANPAFIKAMIAKQEAFWKAVQDREQVEADSSDSARETLAKLFPADTGETVALDKEILEWDQSRQSALEIIKTAKMEVQEADNKLKAAIGSATTGILPDGTKYTYKLTKRKGYIVDATEFRQLRRSK